MGFDDSSVSCLGIPFCWYHYSFTCSKVKWKVGKAFFLGWLINRHHCRPMHNFLMLVSRLSSLVILILVNRPACRWFESLNFSWRPITYLCVVRKYCTYYQNWKEYIYKEINMYNTYTLYVPRTWDRILFSVGKESWHVSKGWASREQTRNSSRTSSNSMRICGILRRLQAT